MRIRRLACVGAIFLFLGYLTLYMLLDMSFPLDSLKASKQVSRRHSKDYGTHDKRIFNRSDIYFEKDAFKPLYNNFLEHTCSGHHHPQANIQMLALYEDLKFDNLDGGVWKQGWSVSYSEDKWNQKKKLKIFVVPHSHNDPGWKKTFEDYYQSQTRSILNNMVVKLLEDRRRKFIWAEISFFALWWQEITNDVKDKVKLLLARNQLEIVTGGWVMNDEANAHYYSILQQLTHGHQWLLQNLNITPRYGWAIDPFGHSPTMPYVLKKMGIESMLIQRTHYSVKKYLAKKKELEFRWRQSWDSNGTTDMLTHMMPFYSYDVPHTCGPDPKVCCQFDFKRLPGYGFTCPWKVPPQIITDSNIAHRANLLLDQYRKKSQLFATDVLIAPLGDDFRYDHPSEWDAQFSNYQKLFDYMNGNPQLNVQAQFGTLSDYFEALQKEQSMDQFPSLSGDFFTYADRDDHYWSGYYTSRPFYKRMDRVLQDYLRSADILFGLAFLRQLKLSPRLSDMLYSARSSLSLFQHHDGITGTAKDHVVQDYAVKMLMAINNCQHIIQQMAHFLLSPSKIPYIVDDQKVYFKLDDVRKLAYSLPEQKTIMFNSIQKTHSVVIYNSLSWHRQEVVTLRVSSPHIKVTDWKEKVVEAQIDPHCQLIDINSQCYDLSFIVSVEPLGMATYYIHQTTADDNSKASWVEIKILNSAWKNRQKEMFEDWAIDFDSNKEFSIQNPLISAAFGETGLLKAVTLKESGITIPLHLSFLKYSARPGKERSGAYLFLPDGEGESLHFQSPLTLVFYGKIRSKVFVQLPNIQHTVILYNSPGPDGYGMEIQNLIDISSLNVNYELAMRVSSNIKSNNIFYTDINGLQMVKRKKFGKLPLQGNYYPMSTAMYIEDNETRLTLLSAQPLGATSLKEGQIEAMQDRKLLQDDNRGLDQGVLDNRPTLSMFRVIIERPQQEDCTFQEPSLSAASFSALENLLHPLHHLLGSDPFALQGLNPTFRAGTGGSTGIDIQLVSLSVLSNLNDNSVGLVLHRTRLDKCFSTTTNSFGEINEGKVNISSLISTSREIVPASLSFLHSGSPVSSSQSFDICSFSLLAFIIPNESATSS